jgi:SAM-dependent methyltransferase
MLTYWPFAFIPTFLLSRFAVRTFALSSVRPDLASSYHTLSDRVIHVGNLDWKVPKEHIIDMLLLAVEARSIQQVYVKELPRNGKKRDSDKFHGGSARLAFLSTDQAMQAMQALQDFSDEGARGLKLRWAPLFNSFEKRPAASLEPQALSTELLELRKKRAEGYARRRLRIAEKTDQVLASVLLQDTEHVLDQGDHLLQLHAPQLNWSECPPQVDPVQGGGLNEGTARGLRKQAAVEAFLFVLQAAFLESDVKGCNHRRRRMVADLGCGAGNLALPLAWWLRRKGYSVLGVDLNSHSLDRLVERAKNIGMTIETLQQDLLDFVSLPSFSSSAHCLDDCAAVVSLHACGSASDLAIAAAISSNLPFAVSPCCIGKVKRAWLPGRMPAVGRDEGMSVSSELSYPRSTWLKKMLPESDYQLLACAADYGVVYNSKNGDPFELARRHRCRMAKRIVEADRLQWAKERNYLVRMVELPRIGPLYPKRELLLGAPSDSPAAVNISKLPTVAGNYGR